jgi:hypothetical protein
VRFLRLPALQHGPKSKAIAQPHLLPPSPEHPTSHTAAQKLISKIKMQKYSQKEAVRDLDRKRRVDKKKK